MEIKNIFKNKTIAVLSAIFIILTIINIVYASLVQRGLTFDGLIQFTSKINTVDNESFWRMFAGRCRHFVMIVNAVPMKLAYYLFGATSKYLLSVFYTLPLFLFPALFPLFNYFLAKRSKRYDIALWSLFLFAILTIPVQIWPIVESMLAVPVIFLLFHYIAANIDYKYYDIVFILLLTVISYSSFEANIYIGPLLFLVALFYAGKTTIKKQKIIKYITGVFCLFMPVGYFLYFFNSMKEQYQYQSFRFFKELFIYKDFTYFYKEAYLLLFITIISAVIFIFLKKFEIKKYSIVIFSFISVFVLFQMINANWFYGIQNFEYRVLMYIIPPVIILLILLIDLFQNKINKSEYQNILLNFLIVILFCGSLNTVAQIFNSYLFKNTVSEILNLTEKIGTEHNKILVNPDEEELIYNNKYYANFRNFFAEDYYMNFVPIFSKEYKIRTILYPGDDAEKRYPPEATKTFKFYLYDENNVRLGHTILNIKNGYWNLEEIANEAKNNARY